MLIQALFTVPFEGQGRVTPYGVYDQARNTGWVNVGIDHDTAEFALESIRHWWNEEGRLQYPQAIGMCYWRCSLLPSAVMTISIAACGPINVPSCS